MRAAVVALVAAVALAAGSVRAMDPDVGKSMTDICLARGYDSIESHFVTTQVPATHATHPSHPTPTGHTPRPMPGRTHPPPPCPWAYVLAFVHGLHLYNVAYVDAQHCGRGAVYRVGWLGP